jgi:hypothetical protein
MDRQMIRWFLFLFMSLAHFSYGNSFSTFLSSEEENETQTLEDEEKESAPASRQNAILRAYYRSQYLNLRSERYDLNETFMENYVDRQIDAFLADIEGRLEGLKYWMAEAERNHEALLCSEDAAEKNEPRRRLAAALKEVDNIAGGLKRRLENVFLRLDGKEKLPIEIAREGDFREEMAFLRKQADIADRRIRDYLFRTTNTVPYVHLQGENMMIRLYWAEKTADGIRDRLRR